MLNRAETTLLQRMRAMLYLSPVIKREFRAQVESCDDWYQLDELLNCPQTPDYVRMWAIDRERQLNKGKC